jgi:hypothetical protein
VARTDTGLDHYLSSLPSTPILPAPQMQVNLRTALAKLELPKPTAWCVNPTDAEAGAVFGVLCRFTRLGSRGIVGMIINMNANATVVGLRQHGADPHGVAVNNGTDVRDGASVVFSLKLAPGQVLVVSI